jgi:hypothetical protein
MGIVCVSFGVQGINNFGWINGFSKKQPLCSASTLIHIKKFIEPQITAKNGILVSHSVVETSFFNDCKQLMVFVVPPSSL